jgi:hypothetical protein
VQIVSYSELFFSRRLNKTYLEYKHASCALMQDSEDSSNQQQDTYDKRYYYIHCSHYVSSAWLANSLQLNIWKSRNLHVTELCVGWARSI